MVAAIGQPQSCLVRVGGGGWVVVGFLLVFFFFPLLFLSLSHLYLFSFSLRNRNILLSSGFLIFLPLFHFLFQSVSFCSSLVLCCVILLQGVIYSMCQHQRTPVQHKATQSTGMMYILLCILVSSL